MPKCMNTDLILNRHRKQSSKLKFLDRPQNQIKIEGSEANGSGKKVLRVQLICKKMQKTKSSK